MYGKPHIDPRPKSVDELMGWTVKQLREYAHEYGISLGYDAANKRSMAQRIASQMETWRHEAEEAGDAQNV